MTRVPEINDSDVLHLTKLIPGHSKPIYVDVNTIPEAKINSCIQAVNEHILNNGGEIIYGWQLWKNQFYIEAEFHAIWKNDLGKLIDISLKNLDTSNILFVPNYKHKYTGQQINNIMLNISNNKLVDDFIELNKAIYRLKNKGDLKYFTGNLNDVLNEREINDILKLEAVKNYIYSMFYFGGTINSNCYCSSGISYKDCHGKNFIHQIKQIR